ncbi:thymidylate synthase [Paracoccus litorisediminis]|uniref:Thymidylate synthase n=2 Tax=Paracoccus litorisediminis TaxID=2006130 RepID=A0A844HPX9_9RHOB|nr:thymidylate synthase [Paracoccus litorisediminis]
MFAKVVAASRSLTDGATLYTVHLRAPRIVWGEILTHRVFSRNARSSRAVPVKAMLNEVRNDPFVPWHWTGAKRGMQGVPGHDKPILLKGSAGQFIDADLPVDPASAWLHGRDMAADLAESFLDSDYHKQVVNRLIEPYSWIDGLITATDWNNFFHLRDHGDAEPHLQDLARITEVALARARVSDLEPGDWHLPFITKEDWIYAVDFYPNFDQGADFLRRVSAARCARISYTPFDGQASYEREIERYNLLIQSERLHASPTEHQATPDRMAQSVTVVSGDGGYEERTEGMAYENAGLHGNLKGFIQARKLLPGEFVHG